MDPKWAFIWYTLSLIFLGLEAAGAPTAPTPWGPKWGWVGLFCFVVPVWWAALQAA